MIKLLNGDEVKVGDKLYRVIDDELFMVVSEKSNETQLEEIRQRLAELEEAQDLYPYAPPYEYPIPAKTTSPDVVPYTSPWYPGTAVDPSLQTTWITCGTDINADEAS